MTQRQNFAGAVNTVAVNRGNVPILKLLLGIVLLAIFLATLIMDVQASESFLLNGAVVSAPDFSVLRQPWDLIHGGLANDVSKAVIWGWGIELIYLVCVVGEVAVHGRAQGWFRTGAVLLVIVNFWTNLNYGTLPSGMGGQIAFSLVSAFIVAFFGVVGFNMVFGALAEWTH